MRACMRQYMPVCMWVRCARGVCVYVCVFTVWVGLWVGWSLSNVCCYCSSRRQCALIGACTCVVAHNIHGKRVIYFIAHDLPVQGPFPPCCINEQSGYVSDLRRQVY